MLNNLERIHLRARRNPLLPKVPLESFRNQTITRTFTLAAGEEITNPIDFVGGAMIIGMGMACRAQGAAATAVDGGLGMVRVAFDLPSQNGSLTPGGAVSAAALFGVDGTKQWPEKEVVMPRQGSIGVTLKNITTSAILVDVAINSLVPTG